MKKTSNSLTSNSSIAQTHRSASRSSRRRSRHLPRQSLEKEYSYHYLSASVEIGTRSLTVIVALKRPIEIGSQKSLAWYETQQIARHIYYGLLATKNDPTPTSSPMPSTTQHSSPEASLRRRS